MTFTPNWPQRPLTPLVPTEDAVESYKTRRLAIGHCAAHDQYIYDCDACLHEALGGGARRKAISEAVAGAKDEGDAIPKRRKVKSE